MLKNSRALVFLLLVIMSHNVHAQAGKAPVNYLGIAGPLSFNNIRYSLAWSSHPNASYYKHEYLPAGEKPEHFNTMLLVEAVNSKLVLKDVVNAKVNELAEMKKSNPYVNYNMIFNQATNEYIIDFLLTVNTAGNKQVTVAEHNLYRYKALPLRAGGTGVYLFAFSRRSYGQEITNFIKNLNNTRPDLINNMAAYKIVLPDLK